MLRFWALLPWAVCVDDLEGEVLEFAEQGAEFLRVVEQRLVFGEFGGGEPAGDGLAGDLAGPFGVGAVQPWRVGVAAAAGLAAGVGADGEGAGQGEARGGELGGDPVAGRALGCGWFHATHRFRFLGPAPVHSIVLWTGSPGRAHAGGAGRGRRLCPAVAAVVGVAAGGGIRPGGDRAGGAGGAGAGEEPVVGGGQAGRLRGVAGPGPGAGGGAAPVGSRAVHPVRAGPDRGGAPDAAHQLAVHRPAGGAAAVSGRSAAAAGARQGALWPSAD